MPLEGDLNDRQLSLLFTLRALLRLRSVREAALEMGVSDATVSRRLSELRDWTGDPLLIRIGSGMHPTEHALQIEAGLAARLNALSELLTARRPEAPPIVTIATSDAFHGSALASALQDDPSLRIRHVTPESCAPNVATALIHGDVDMYIGPALGLSEGVHRRLLIDADFVTVLRADHPAATPLDLDSFCALRHVLVSARSPPRSLVDDALAQQGRQRSIVLETASFTGALAIVASTDLSVTMPRGPATAAARRVPLKLTPVPVAIPLLPIYAHWHARRHADAGHRRLRERLARAIQG